MTNTVDVTGVCPVLSATFTDSGELDMASFSRMCDHLMNTEVRSVMIFGVATENSKLSDSERDLMLEALVRSRGSQDVRIVATVADHGTHMATARSRRWVDLGADIINILPSYFLQPAIAEVVEHLDAILSSVNVPMIIQSLPAGGAEVPLSALLALQKSNNNLRQIKVENTPASPLVKDIQAFSGGVVSALVGWGGLEWAEASEAGAVGVQPGCSLVELYLDAQRFLDHDDTAGFEAAFAPLRQPLTTWMRHPEVLIAIEKRILHQRGIIASSQIRKPSAPLLASDYALAEEMLSLVAERKAN